MAQVNLHTHSMAHSARGADTTDQDQHARVRTTVVHIPFQSSQQRVSQRQRATRRGGGGRWPAAAADLSQWTGPDWVT